MDSIKISSIDNLNIHAQMTVITYLKQQVEKLENEVLSHVFLTYGVDIRQGWTLDLGKGEIRREQPDSSES